MAITLVTGASRGIGLEVCAQLKARGDDVIAVCRTTSPKLSALGVRVIDGVDVSDAGSVNRLKTELAGQNLDVLINNAGILRSDSFGALDYEVMLEQYRVNALGPLGSPKRSSTTSRRGPRSRSSAAGLARSKTTVRAAITATEPRRLPSIRLE